MKTHAVRIIFAVILPFSAAPPLCPQEPRVPQHKENEDVKLPDGRSQKDAILKADHEKNIQDAQRLSRLAGELQTNFEKNTRFVFSLEDLKKTEEIEKLARQIRSRMKRY